VVAASPTSLCARERVWLPICWLKYWVNPSGVFAILHGQYRSLFCTPNTVKTGKIALIAPFLACAAQFTQIYLTLEKHFSSIYGLPVLIILYGGSTG
jgi:hypothetical protein